jgi:hypothetical protein
VQEIERSKSSTIDETDERIARLLAELQPLLARRKRLTGTPHTGSDADQARAGADGPTK